MVNLLNKGMKMKKLYTNKKTINTELNLNKYNTPIDVMVVEFNGNRPVDVLPIVPSIRIFVEKEKGEFKQLSFIMSLVDELTSNRLKTLSCYTEDCPIPYKVEGKGLKQVNVISSSDLKDMFKKELDVFMEKEFGFKFSDFTDEMFVLKSEIVPTDVSLNVEFEYVIRNIDIDRFHFLVKQRPDLFSYDIKGLIGNCVEGTMFSHINVIPVEKKQPKDFNKF